MKPQNSAVLHKKETLVQHLKQEIDSYKGKAKEYQDLTRQYEALDSRFKQDVTSSTLKTQSFKSRIEDTEAEIFSLKIKLDSLKSSIQQDARLYTQRVDEAKRIQQVGMRRADECETIVQTCNDRDAEIKQLNQQLEQLMLGLAKLREEKGKMVAKNNTLNGDSKLIQQQMSQQRNRAEDIEKDTKLVQNSINNLEEREQKTLQDNEKQKNIEKKLLEDVMASETRLSRAKIELASVQDVIQEKQLLSQQEWRTLREEENMQRELKEKISHFERQNKMLAEREQTLSTQKSYLTEMRLQGAQRLTTLQFEKESLETTCKQLSEQNQKLLGELSHFTTTHEYVRDELHRNVDLANEAQKKTHSHCSTTQMSNNFYQQQHPMQNENMKPNMATLRSNAHANTGSFGGLMPTLSPTQTGQNYSKNEAFGKYLSTSQM